MVQLFALFVLLQQEETASQSVVVTSKSPDSTQKHDDVDQQPVLPVSTGIQSCSITPYSEAGEFH